MKRTIITILLVFSVTGFSQLQKTVVDASGNRIIRNIVPPSPPPKPQPLTEGVEALKTSVQNELEHPDTVLIDGVPAFRIQ